MLITRSKTQNNHNEKRTQNNGVDVNKSLIIIVLFLLMYMPLLSEELIIQKIEFSGNDNFNKKTLIKLINCKPDPILQRLNPLKKANQYHRETIEFDQEILKNHYQRNGFLNVSIQQNIEIINSQAIIKYIINENDPIITEHIFIEINFIEEDQRFEIQQEIKEKINQVKDKYEQKIFIDQSVEDFKNEINQIFRDYSYLKPQITPEYQLNNERNKLGIRYIIKSNSFSYITDIQFKGLNYVPERSLNFQLSDVSPFYYHDDPLEEIEYRIQQLNHFQRISSEVESSDSTESKQSLSIYLVEKPKRVLKMGIGYGIEDHFRISADYQKMNFLGNCRILDLSFKSSYLEPWNLSINSQEPIPIRHSLYSNSSVFFRKENEDVYEIERLGFISGFKQMINRKHSYSIYGMLEQNNLRYADSYSSDSLQSVYNKAILAGNYDFQQEKESKGLFSQYQINYSSRAFGSPYEYIKTMMIHRLYIPLSKINTLALKAKVGQLQSFNSDKVIPVEERFFAGGSQSIRGWSRNDISPINENKEKIGGHSIIEFSIEERIMVYSSLEWSLFYDGGNVWKEEIDLNDLKHSVGTGLRYHSPIGVLRLDFAHPISKDTKTNQIYFQIGYSF